MIVFINYMYRNAAQFTYVKYFMHINSKINAINKHSHN